VDRFSLGYYTGIIIALAYNHLMGEWTVLNLVLFMAMGIAFNVAMRYVADLIGAK